MRIVKTDWLGTTVYTVRYNPIERISQKLADLKVKNIKKSAGIEWKK